MTRTLGAVFNSTHAKLLAVLLPVIALATLVSVAGLEHFLSGFFHARLEREATALGEAARASLEQQMLFRVPDLTQRTIEEMGGTAGIRRILIVDRAGRVAQAYPTSERGRVLDATSEEGCRDCHEPGAPARTRSSLVTDTSGHRVFRVATPIENRTPCQQCHGTAARLNGVLVIERAADAEAEALATMRSRLGLTWLATFVVLAALIGAVTTLIVHRPVRRLIDVTRRIGHGDLSARAEVSGRGEIAELATTLNAMAADLGGSLEQIREKTAELAVLYSIVDRMSRTVFIGELKPLILQVVTEVLGSPRVALVCPAMDGAGLECYERDTAGEVSSVTVRLNDIDGVPLLVPSGVVRRWLRGGLTEIDLDAAPGLAIMPLRFRDRDLALLGIAAPCNRSFVPDDQRLLGALRAHISVAFENARLYTLAITDELTQLYAVRHFQVSLEEAVRRFQRYGESVGLLMLDLDRFKLVNDTYGHPAGDAALKEIAKRVRATVRDADLPCRYGGEEFAVILPHTDAAGAVTVAERIRAAVAAVPIPIADGRELSITASVGVAVCPAHATTAQGLVSRADRALYRAKHSGGDRVCCDHEDEADTVPAVTGVL